MRIHIAPLAWTGQLSAASSPFEQRVARPVSFALSAGFVCSLGLAEWGPGGADGRCGGADPRHCRDQRSLLERLPRAPEGHATDEACDYRRALARDGAFSAAV